MKGKYHILGRTIDCEHKELFKLEGEARYETIRNLPVIAPELICAFYKHCYKCPLFIRNVHGKGLCSDVASDREVYNMLSCGGKFLTLEECSDEKDN